MGDNIPISEQWQKAAQHWVELEAAASLLEDTKSSVLSQLMLQSTEKSVAAKEMVVKASPGWLDHVRKIGEARRAANLAKVEADYLRMKMQEWISADANHRLQAKL